MHLGILIAQNSPRGVHDQDDNVHYGFEALNEYVARRNPRLLIHGHQHLDRETVVGQTRIMGALGHKVVEMGSNLSP